MTAGMFKIRGYGAARRLACVMGALLVALSGLLVGSGCARVAVTNRRQFNVIPDSTMLSLSLQQYQQFLAEAKISQDAAKRAMVERVGRRIAAAVEQYFAQIGRADQLAGYDWQFTLVESEEQNA